MQQSKSPYQYHNGKLGFKSKYLYADVRFHNDSLKLIKYNTFYLRLNSQTCREKELRRSSLGYPALVEFYSLCPEWRSMITTKWPQPKEQIKQSWFSQHYITDGKALRFYKDYRYGDNKENRLTDEVIEIYTHQASVLNTVLLMKVNRKDYAKALNVTQFNIWESLSHDVNNFNEVVHNLPTKPTTLRHKVTRYTKGTKHVQAGYMALISGKYGLRNAAKVVRKDQTSLLLTSH